MNVFFSSILLIMMGGALAPALRNRFLPMKTASAGLIGVGCLTGLIHAVACLFSPEPSVMSFHLLKAFPLTFSMDGLSAFFLTIIFGITLLAALYSFHYCHSSKKSTQTAVGYLFFSLLTASMVLVATAANLVTFLLFWEIMSLSSFFLVIHDYRNPENQKAGYLYLVFSHVGFMFICAAFGILYGVSGSIGFEGGAMLPEQVKIIVFVLAFVGFGSKAGVFPLHLWLPEAHPAAPSHVSAVMSGVMIKTGIYGILRMYAALNHHGPLFGEMLVAAGMVSGILGVVYALGQHDLKRLLAYHSVENIGIILIGLGVGMMGVSSGQPVTAALGFGGGLLHIMNHAIFKALLFMGAGMVIMKTGRRSIDALGGLMKTMPVTGITFLAGSLAISGLPPLNGFVSEFFIYLGGFKAMGKETATFVPNLLSVISLAVIGGLALACFTKVVGVVFQGEPRTNDLRKVDEKGYWMPTSMAVLAVLCAVIGVFPQIFLMMAIKAIAALNIGYGRIPSLPFMETAGHITRATLTLMAVFFGLLCLRSWLYRGKPIHETKTWGCGFSQPSSKMQYTGASYARSIVLFFKPVAPLKEEHPGIQGLFPGPSHYHSHAGDIAQGPLDHGIVRPVLFFFDRLRWIQHGDIHLYIGYILLALVVLLVFV